ncbi:zinc finger protein 518A isoform X3 [Equus asinus]|uniref:zinc finger protein 518A isoform X3 n=1 Tax=Equus asinus TaxID=9793 RepID=UPI0038F691A4
MAAKPCVSKARGGETLFTKPEMIKISGLRPFPVSKGLPRAQFLLLVSSLKSTEWRFVYHSIGSRTSPAAGAARIPPPQRALPVALRSAFRQYPDGSVMAAIRDSQAMGTTTAGASNPQLCLASGPGSKLGIRSRPHHTSAGAFCHPKGRHTILVSSLHFLPQDEETSQRGY